MDSNSDHDFVLEDHVGKNSSSRPTNKKTYDCDETSTKEEIELEKLSAKFTCRFCIKTYQHKRTLTAHEKGHSQVENFACHLCDKTFMHNKSLNRHKWNDHHDSYVEDLLHQYRHKACQKKKEFTCRFCTKIYQNKRTLTEHEKVHSSQQNFVCQVCNKKFKHNKSLIRHKKAHSQVQNFACQLCNKTFRQKYNIKDHEKTQHRSCNWCDYKTKTSKENIEKHIYNKHYEEAMEIEIDRRNLARGFTKE